MEALLNILVNVVIYMSIPVAIRYIILRRPIVNKWIAIGILAPLFIVFAVLTTIQKEEAQGKIYRELGIPRKATPIMFGSPILYGAMIASYFILRRGRKGTETVGDSTTRKKTRMQAASQSSPETAPPNASAPNRFCSHCGTPIEVSAKFCPKCGTSVVRSN